MTDTDKLKRLAERMAAREIFGIKLNDEECREYGQAILALIAENERLRRFNELCYAFDLKSQRDEAVALLRDAVLHCGPTSTESDINSFLARIDNDKNA